MLVGDTYSSWHQVSPATMRKRVQKEREKEPNSTGSSLRNIVTPTIESVAHLALNRQVLRAYLPFVIYVHI
jgi:hypothetical protein